MESSGGRSVQDLCRVCVQVQDIFGLSGSVETGIARLDFVIIYFDDPRLLDRRHPLAGGGMSSPYMITKSNGELPAGVRRLATVFSIFIPCSGDGGMSSPYMITKSNGVFPAGVRRLATVLLINWFL